MTDKHFRTHPAAVDDHSKGGFIVWRADRGGVFSLNRTGAKVWRRLRATSSPRQVSAGIATESGADERVVRGHVEELIRSLHSAGLVESVSHSVPPHSDLTLPTRSERAAALNFIGTAISPACSIEIPEATAGFWEEVARLAFRYRISGLLRNQIDRYGRNEVFPHWLSDHLAALQKLSQEQNRRVREQLNEVVAALNRNGIEPLLLKGAAMLFAEIYVGDGDRWMSDIDLLLPAEELGRGLNTVVALGFRQGGNPCHDYGDHHHLAPLLRFEGELPIELHRSLLPREFSSILPVSAVFADSVPVAHPTLRFRVLSPTHRVIHAIAHAQLVDRHFARGTLPLRELSDYAWLVHHDSTAIDPSALIATFADHKDALAGFLLAGERLFGVTQPPGYRPSLAGRLYWWRASRGVRWNPSGIWNDRLYRLSASYLREQTGCGPGFWSLGYARIRHIARSLVRLWAR